MRYAFLLLAALAAGASGCSASGPPSDTGPAATPSLRRLAATSDSLLAAPSAPARRALAVRLLGQSGVTPLADMGRLRAANPRFTVDAASPVAGFVPGRYPLARDELVIVGTSLGGPHVAPLVEAMRVLAERSRWTPAPERTVMVALWSGPNGAREALTSAVWPRQNIRAVLAVGEAAAVPDSLEAVAIPAAPATTAGERLALAQRVLDETLRLARRPAPADTIP